MKNFLAVDKNKNIKEKIIYDFLKKFEEYIHPSKSLSNHSGLNYSKIVKASPHYKTIHYKISKFELIYDFNQSIIIIETGNFGCMFEYIRTSESNFSGIQIREIHDHYGDFQEFKNEIVFAKLKGIL